jgi:DNA-binding protein
MQPIKLRNGETRTLEIMVVSYRSQHIVKTVDIAENLRRRFSLVAKNRRVMVEPVDSQMDLGK